MPLQQAIEVIEGSFQEGSAEYFKAMASKASELMDMEQTAFEQLRGAIIAAGTIKPLVDEEEVQAGTGKTFAQHLVQESNAIAGVNMSVMGGQQLSEKEQLRRELGLGSSQPTSRR